MSVFAISSTRFPVARQIDLLSCFNTRLYCADPCPQIIPEPCQRDIDRMDVREFGLKLIQKNTGRTRFELGVEAVEDPDKYMSDLVVRSYRDEAGDAEGDSEEPAK